MIENPKLVGSNMVDLAKELLTYLSQIRISIAFPDEMVMLEKEEPK